MGTTPFKARGCHVYKLFDHGCSEFLCLANNGDDADFIAAMLNRSVSFPDTAEAPEPEFFSVQNDIFMRRKNRSPIMCARKRDVDEALYYVNMLNVIDEDGEPYQAMYYPDRLRVMQRAPYANSVREVMTCESESQAARVSFELNVCDRS